MLQVTVNGTTIELPTGHSVLDAVRAAGVDLPTYCHDDRLAPTGACRACLVNVSGRDKPVPACATPLDPGMRIDTDTDELRTFRSALTDMLAPRRADAPLVDDTHPYIRVDMSRCIDCYRCVRICDDVQGQFTWHVRDRGRGTRIVPDGPTLADSSCVSCGACADTCPTGAIADRIVSVGTPPPTRWTRTVCPYCGVGCELEVGTRNNAIVGIRPVPDAPVNRGHLCVKGRYAFDFAAAPDRVTMPLLRDRGKWRPVTWDVARAVVADRLGRLIARHGPDCVGVLGSARATNEDNYVAQKLARAVIGTNNVDCCARVCHAPSAAALKRSLGSGLATNSFADIERARTILVFGANPTENHPVVGARIKQAARRGATLIVVDARRTEIADWADVHLAIRPGTNIPLLLAMAHVILTEDFADRSYLETRVTGLDDFGASVAAWPPERAASECGVDAAIIRRAAMLYATRRPSMSVHGLGLTEHEQGTDGVTALINLALLTGNIGVPGGGVNPLRGQNNVQGAAHMGCDPALLPGSVPIEAGRAAFERQWGTLLPRTRGLNTMEMIDAALNGRLKALWAIGFDIAATLPDCRTTLRALQSLDLVIVQDLFLTATARACATVFLPACSTYEKDGTFMNGERRIQRVRAALPPAGASRPDWQIICDIAREMDGRGFDYSGPEAIWDELRALAPGAAGMSYQRLDTGGLQWPCPSLDHPGTAILHTETFAPGGRAPLMPIAYRRPEGPSAEYPYGLITGRSLYQFNASSMSGRTPNATIRPTDTLDISPSDAKALSLREGDRVRVVSRHGSAVLPVSIRAGMREGELFATFHDPASEVNAVTGRARDPITSTPAYKVTAVRIERT